MAAKRGPKGPITDEHKAAMATGRTEGKAVRSYLEALRSNKPRRGRKRTPDSVRKRLDAINAEMVDADAVREVKLIQERMDLENELSSSAKTFDMSALEQQFIAMAKSYSDRNGISYSAWRQVGVEASVLTKAGIRRSS